MDSSPEDSKKYGLRIYTIIKNGPLDKGGARELTDFIIPPDEMYNNQINFQDWVKSHANQEITLSLYSLLTKKFREIKIITNPVGSKDGILGASVKKENWTIANKNVLHITSVAENSFAQKELGLIPLDDYIIGVKSKTTPIIPLNQDDFSPLEILGEVIRKNRGKLIKFYIYNKKKGARDVTVTIGDDYYFSLGCEGAFGALHMFPSLETSVSKLENNIEESEKLIKEIKETINDIKQNNNVINKDNNNTNNTNNEKKVTNNNNIEKKEENNTNNKINDNNNEINNNNSIEEKSKEEEKEKIKENLEENAINSVKNEENNNINKMAEEISVKKELENKIEINEQKNEEIKEEIKKEKENEKENEIIKEEIKEEKQKEKIEEIKPENLLENKIIYKENEDIKNKEEIKNEEKKEEKNEEKKEEKKEEVEEIEEEVD